MDHLGLRKLTKIIIIIKKISGEETKQNKYRLQINKNKKFLSIQWEYSISSKQE